MLHQGAIGAKLLHPSKWQRVSEQRATMGGVDEDGAIDGNGAIEHSRHARDDAPHAECDDIDRRGEVANSLRKFLTQFFEPDQSGAIVVKEFRRAAFASQRLLQRPKSPWPAEDAIEDECGWLSHPSKPRSRR